MRRPRCWWRGNAEQRALGLIALNQHVEADGIIQELKNRPGNPIDEAFRLCTMEGDNWYQANEPDKAVEPYERAMALKPAICRRGKILSVRSISPASAMSQQNGDVPSMSPRNRWS